MRFEDLLNLGFACVLSSYLQFIGNEEECFPRLNVFLGSAATHSIHVNGVVEFVEDGAILLQPVNELLSLVWSLHFINYLTTKWNQRRASRTKNWAWLRKMMIIIAKDFRGVDKMRRPDAFWSRSSARLTKRRSTSSQIKSTKWGTCQNTSAASLKKRNNSFLP